MLYFRQFITPNLKTLIENHYPCVITDLSLRNFVMHLLLVPHKKDWSTGTLEKIISHADIAAFTNQKISNKDWRSGDFIKKIKSIPELSHLEFGEYVPTKRSRTILDSHAPQEIYDAVQYEISVKKHKELIYYATGAKLSGQKASNIKKSRKQYVETLSQTVGVTHTQKYILDYLNNLHELTFSSKIEQNYVKASNAIYDLYGTDTMRDRYVEMLGYIRHTPQPLYYTSPGTHRLQTRYSIVHLPRSVRKALCSGWIDFDISSAYLAIIAKLLNLTETNKVLDIGVWKYLENNNINKSQEIKKILYSLCFGGSLKKITKEYSNNDEINKLIKLPFIQELKIECNKKLKSIMDEHKCTHKIARGSLSKLISKIELELLKPAFEIANSKDYIDIVLYQFDGFTISVADDKRVHAIHTMTKKLNENFEKLGYKTKMTYEIL